MSNRRRYRPKALALAATFLAAAAVALLMLPAPVLACPGCVSPADQQVQEGFFWGLVFMMVAPWVVVATIGGGLYLAIRRERRQAVEEFLRSEALTPFEVREGSDVSEP